MQDVPLPFPRHLDTPSRDEAVRSFRRDERQTILWLAIEVAIACGCVAWLIGGGASTTVETFVLAGASALCLFEFLPGMWFRNRQLLRDIRADARFGPHSRDSLLECVNRVAATLGIRRGCPVYLVRDKEINAEAVPFALLPGIGSLGAVQINRSVLHLLDEPEVEAVIGHELGHVFFWAPLASRCMLIHAWFAASLTLVLAEMLAGTDLRFGAPLLALWPGRWLAFHASLERTRAIEFLCDDCGAKAVGTEAAMMSHIKIAIEQETRDVLFQQILAARLEGADIPIETLMATYAAALPFGSVSPVEAERAIRESVTRFKRESKEVSLIGFWRYVFADGDVDEEALRNMVDGGHAVRAVARVSPTPRDVIAGEATLAECVSSIEQQPTGVFVHLADEIDDRTSTHPNVSRRLLFLWRSRGNALATGGDRGPRGHGGGEPEW